MSIETISNISANLFCWFRNIIFVKPLRRLYFNGPDLKSFGFISIGFWNGLTYPEICAQLTTISERHWLQHPELCDIRIERQFLAFVVMAEFILYLIVVGYGIKRLVGYFFPNELTNEIRALRQMCDAKFNEKFS